MKKILASLLFLSTFIVAQVPQGINYQGIARSGNGDPILGQSISLEFSIYDQLSGGTLLYAEATSKTSDAVSGIFTHVIGNGSPSFGAFNTIDWSTGLKFLEIKINGNLLGRQQMMSVPFALYAEKAGNAASPSLQINGHNVSISGGNTITLPTSTITVQNTSLTGSGVASVSTIGTNSFNVFVPQVNLTGTGNSTVLGTFPNYTVNTGAGPTSTLIGDVTGIITSNTVTSIQGNSVAAATPTIGQVLQYIAPGIWSPVTLAPPSNPTITGTGIVSVTPLTGNNFTVSAITPSFIGLGSTSVSGTYPSYTITTPTVSTPWSLTGNAGTSPTVNFIGTTDNVGLAFRVNNQKAGIIDPISWNTFFGHQSGFVNIGGSNTAFGYRSMFSNTSGIENVAYGFRSLFSNTTGPNNTAIGVNALYSNTTGNNNTALGYAALYSNITGTLNCAFGVRSLSVNTTGSENVAMGYNSLLNNTTGNANTAIGSNALYSETSGSGNTSIGYQSGYLNSTGNGNVFIGYRAGYNELGSNKLHIANSNTATPLIYGDFATSLIGMGTTAPTENLQIESGASTRISLVSANASSSQLWMGTSGTHSLGFISYDNGTNNMIFGTNSTMRMRIFGNGDMAFGSTNIPNPSGAHFIFTKPGANDTKLMVAGGDNNNSYGGMITLAENSNATVGMTMKLDAGGNRLVFANDLNGASGVMSIGGYAGANPGVSIGSGIYFLNAPVNGLIVEGNTGLGTTAPTSRLDVDGTVKISGANTNELNRAQTGDANLVPIAYANANSDGTLNGNATTVNVTLASHAAGSGLYYYNITGETIHFLNNVTVATLNGTNGEISWNSAGGQLVIVTYNSSGTPADKAFTFVLYKK